METESKTGDSVAAGDATQSARTSPMTKERFMATYRFQGNEKFWEKWKAELENPNHNYHRLALESAQSYQRVQEQDQLIQVKDQLIQVKDQLLQELEQKAGSSSRNIERQRRFVLSVSTAAGNPSLRKRFRSKIVGNEPCRGGFVALKYYLDFVLAAREFQGYCPEEETKQLVIDALSRQGELLKKRTGKSLFPPVYEEEESPQSAVASDMLQLAIDWFQDSVGVARDCRLRVSHQMNVIGSTLPSDDVISSRRTGERNGDGIGTSVDGGSDKINDRIDLCVWFVHDEKSLGACVAAIGEYKPNNKSPEIRKAQADMYGSNIFFNHEKPCIIIDIAGGNTLSEWQISATGLVNIDGQTDDPSWETTPLYSGKGAEGIVSIAWGLVKAKPSFPRALKDFGRRLGPVVGLIGEHVYKAYDIAETRNPNIEVLKFMMGEDNVEIMESKDEKIKIVKMKRLPNDWTQKINAKDSFGQIIVELQKLHENFGPHGDIRVANLTSSGHIIDFDFVGRKFYPSTLNKISSDGRRHPTVEGWIDQQASTCGAEKEMEMTKFHDWFSLKKAMELFKPVDDSNAEVWNEICRIVWKDDTDESQLLDDYYKNLDIDAIFRRRDFTIELIDPDIPLPGTGNTPIKEQPTKPAPGGQSKRRKTGMNASPSMSSPQEKEPQK